MRKLLTMLAIIGLFGGLVIAGASADEFDPDTDTVDVDLGVDPTVTNVDVTLVATGDGPPQAGCDLKGGGHYVDAVAASSNTAVATVEWAAGGDTQTFGDCDETNTLVITAIDCGSATVSVTDGGHNATGWATFNQAVITVTVTGDDCGGMTVCTEPAAPAWANAILGAYNASVPKNQQVKARDHGEAVSSVAREMEPTASFWGVAKSMQDDYADAVWQFLQAHTGKSLPHPSDPGVARPGWGCVAI